MNFKEAYSKLLEGKKIRRTSWDKKYYICMKNELTYDAVGDTTKPITNIDLDSAAADDWEVVEESKVWKPKKGEKYYYIYSDGCVTDDTNDCSNTDEDRYSLGSCFKTREEAEHMVEKLKVIKELKDFALENNEEELDWKNSRQTKYFIAYEKFYDCIITYDTTVTSKLSPFDIYFVNRETAKKAIVKIGEDRIKKYYFDIGE